MRANVKSGLTAGVLALAVIGGATTAGAHGTSRIQRELRDEGYQDIKITGAKAPFDVDACRSGDRYHLRIDFYGKKIEETRTGFCDAGQPRAAAAVDQPAVAVPDPAPAKEVGCKRYFPATGTTVSVPCTDK